MTIEVSGGRFGSQPADRFISTRRIGERKGERYQRCIYEIKIFFRMCSSATVNTTNSTTDRKMILESLINSYLDFLKRIFTPNWRLHEQHQKCAPF